MASLVSLESVKAALHIDSGDDDTLLQDYIESVQEAVLRYLRVLGENDWTEETVPKAVRLAIIMGVQSVYDPDRLDLIAGLASSDPKNPIVAMLCMMRRPTVR
ncbi:head-tail connector protein [Chelativorans sp. J32]|uniref:head-tail connector protein n=1 Tax=Chelativorans sp. J32 TaxID=935840 RepID=UPI0004BCE334|nr:head-tail connector protein [Chelativorans sp. J32]